MNPNGTLPPQEREGGQKRGQSGGILARGDEGDDRQEDDEHGDNEHGEESPSEPPLVNGDTTPSDSVDAETEGSANRSGASIGPDPPVMGNIWPPGY